MFRPVVFSAIAAALLMPAAAQACVPPMVAFAFGSVRVSPDGQREVSLVSQMARTNPRAMVKLTATTDGSRPNQEMARRRVNVIKAMLARAGVAERRIDVDFISALGDGSARLVMMELVSSPTCGS